jgi:hypothetical protein
MADTASLPAEEIINVDDDDDDNGDDEWQSLFHVSREAVEGVISSRKAEGGKKKANLALLEFIATKGKNIFMEGYLVKEDYIFFMQLASTVQLKERKRHDVWTSPVIAGHLCTYYMLLKKHDDNHGIYNDRVIDYQMAVDEATRAATTTTASTADSSKTTITASAATTTNSAADSLPPSSTAAVDLEVMEKLASLVMLMRNSIARAIADKEEEQGRSRSSMTKQSDLMSKNQKKPMQQKMIFDSSQQSKFSCSYCGHHAVMSTLQEESNERNKQKTAQFNKDLAKYNKLPPAQKKKAERPKPPKDTVQQLEVCMCSILNCRGRVDGVGCDFCVAMNTATGREPPKDDSHRCICGVCMCTCTAVYALSQRVNIANHLAGQEAAGTTAAADAPNDAGLIGNFLFEIGDSVTNNFMHQQTTNGDPSATFEDMYRNAAGMTATNLMTARSIQDNIPLKSAMQHILVPRGEQTIMAGRNSNKTLAQLRQEKKDNSAIQKRQKAAARGQQQQQVGMGQKKAPPTAAADATPVTTTPATATTTSSTNTFASDCWSTGSRCGALNFVGAGSNNSRGYRNCLSTTTNTPNPFNVTASLFQQDVVVGGAAGGGQAAPHEPPPAAAAAVSTPRRTRSKRVRVGIMKSMKAHNGAKAAFRALVAESPTAMQLIEDSIGTLCTQDAADTLMEMYDGGSSQQAHVSSP